MQKQKNEIKQDNDEIGQMVHHIQKVETIEGILLYIYSSIQDHPQNEKVKFNFGQMHIFKEDLQLRCYRGELGSFECLNREIDWTSKYFDHIHSSLENKSQDIMFSFKNGDTEEIVCDYVLRISERLNQKQLHSSEVCLLKVYLKHIPSLSNLDTFYRLCNDQINRKNKLITQLEQKNNNTINQRQKLVNDVEFISQQAKERERIMINKFVALLNEKKQEIRQLTQMNGLMNNQIIEEPQIQYQKEYNSQFMVSQPFDILFTQEDRIKYEIGDYQQKKKH